MVVWGCFGFGFGLVGGKILGGLGMSLGGNVSLSGLLLQTASFGGIEA